MITTDDVIRHRQTEIFNRVSEIEKDLNILQRQAAQLEKEKQRLMVEHDILDAHNDRGQITMTTTTTVRMGSKDKLLVEDTVKKVFDNAGRPLRMVELINELEKFGYVWSRYESAHGYLRNLGCVQKVPQTRGVYQWIR